MTEPQDQKILVFVNCSSLGEAEVIVKDLLQRRLIACGTVGTHAHSYYRWQEKKQESTEYPVVLKSSLRFFPDIEARVRALHSYEVPEILAVPVIAGTEAYLQWMDSNLG